MEDLENNARSAVNLESLMAMTIDQTFPIAEFYNKHGELFIIHGGECGVYVSGNEVRKMVPDKYKIGGKYLPLFNEHFNIWSRDELFWLGESLTKLYKQQKR